jgi:hypothetical protein
MSRLGRTQPEDRIQIEHMYEWNGLPARPYRVQVEVGFGNWGYWLHAQKRLLLIDAGPQQVAGADGQVARSTHTIRLAICEFS